MIRGNGKSNTTPATENEKHAEKTPEVPGDIEVTEEVVLSADDRFTPASAVVGGTPEDGVPQAGQAQSSSKTSAKKLAVVPGLLGVIRIPEQILIRAYKDSSARAFLLKKVDWYQDFEDNQIMGRTLEAAYGGASSRRYRLQRFVRDNLLFTLLMCVGLFYAGQYAVHSTTGLGPQREIIKTIKSKTSAKPKPGLAAVDATGKPKDASRRAITSALDHCSVQPDVRAALLSQLGEKSEFQDDALSQAMREFRRFQKRYRATGIKKWYREAGAKRSLIGDAMRTALPQIESFLSSQQNERRDTQRLLENKEQQFAQMYERGSLKEVNHVNEWIRVRDQIIGIKERLEEGPSGAALLALAEQLESAKQTLADGAPTKGRIWDSDADWNVETQTMDVAAVRAFVSDTVQDIESLLTIQPPVTAKLNAYRVQNTRSHLQKLADALAVHNAPPSALIRSIEQSQDVANERL